MKPSLFARFLHLAALLALAVSAHASQYKTGPVPAWVIAIEPALGAKVPEGVREGQHALLSDRQVRIDARGKHGYYHFASKALDSKGVSRVGDISLTFDPSYQSITLHYINVLREGRTIAKRDTAKIRILQRETEMEYRIFDGSKTVSVVLDDLRQGDIVDYAYSITGSNPVFGKLTSGGADLQWGVPVKHAFVRLLAATDRQFHIKQHNTAVKPSVTESAGMRDTRWDLNDVPALRVDEDAPEDYDPYPTLQWSEFADWEAVVRWALPLYRATAPKGGPLAREIAAIKNDYANPGERLTAVLRLAQRDVRYLGIEVGQGSHAPSMPELVYKRRFGDCKDKALLMVTMLRALDIDAQVALVNTKMRARIAAYAPAPGAFDHAIVHARIDGTSYWLDPTRSEQKSALAHVTQSDYAFALVLDPASKALTPMQAPRVSAKKVRSVFDARRGILAPVLYTITTTSSGRAADYMRSTLEERGITDLQRDYLNFYAKRYPTIQVAEALGVTDDEQVNTVTITESYAIPEFFAHEKEKKRREGIVRSAEVQSRFTRPEAMHRSAPLRLRFPDDIEEVTEVKLPEKWQIETSKTQVDDPAFEFQQVTEGHPDGRGLTLRENYHARSPSIAPEQVAAYAASQRKALDSLGYWLWQDDAPTAQDMAGKFNAKAVGAAVMMGVWLLLYLLWLTSAPKHRLFNGKMLMCAVIPTVIAMGLWFGLSGEAAMLSTLVLLLSGNYAALVLAQKAPQTHWAFGIEMLGQSKAARREAQQFTPAYNMLRNALPAIPKSLIWAIAGWAMLMLID